MLRERKTLSATVAEELKDKIQKGFYKPGEQLPPEIDFAKELGVSRATLRDALSRLELDGMVTRRHGIGSFISEGEHQIVSNFDRLESMVDLIKRSGYDPSVTVLSQRSGPLNNDVCTSLKLPPGTRGVHFITLYSANNIPFVYTKEYAPESLLPEELKATRLESEDLADFLSKNSSRVPVATLTKLKGILPTEELMTILMIDSNSPIIRQHFTLFDRQNLPIGCGYDYFNSSWFEFSIYTKTTRL